MRIEKLLIPLTLGLLANDVNKPYIKQPINQSQCRSVKVRKARRLARHNRRMNRR